MKADAANGARLAAVLVLLAAGCGPKREAARERESAPPSAAGESETAAGGESAGDLAAGSDAAPPDPAASPDASVSPWEDARRRGATFRAIGQEPGWHLEIQDEPAAKRIRFLYAYGESSLSIDAATLTVDTENARATYRGEAGGRVLEVELSDGPCVDSMSGEEFETRVEVRLGGSKFAGCGRSLRTTS